MNPNIDFKQPAEYNDQEYMALYTGFMDKYRIAEVSAEEVGQVLSQLAQHYAFFNLRVTNAERKLSLVAQDIESRRDDNQKIIASTKAKVFVDATPEAEVVGILKAHRENCDMFISCLRSLQKGLLQEYTHMGAS